MPVAPSKSILSPACAAVSNTKNPWVSSVASSRAISPVERTVISAGTTTGVYPYLDL